MEKPRLYPIRDIASALRSFGNIFLGLGVCLLLLVRLQFYPSPTPEVAALGQETTVGVSAEDRIAERMVPPSRLVEEKAKALRQKLEEVEVEGDESVAATPEPSTPEAMLASGIELPAGESGVQNVAPPATRLVIPALGIDAPVVEIPITNKTWDVSALTYEIAHLGGTANPGEKNNMVLAGHVTLTRGAGPFLHLESLKPGDMAIVYAGEQAYTYVVVSKGYFGPTDVSMAYPASDSVLTLITCTNWDLQNLAYTERVAVIAELVEEEAP